MIASPIDSREDIWKSLSAPLPAGAIQWRQDGRPTARDGKHFARFVGYIDAQFVHERLDSVVPGEWDSTLEMLPPVHEAGTEEAEPFAFKCRLQVLGVIREDVGTGKDYKTAASDALKRAAVRFGIGKELYALQPNWVQMDGDGKYAKPVEDPGVAYARRYGKASGPKPLADGGADIGITNAALAPTRERGPDASGTDEVSNASTARTGDEPSCPKCGGRLWDNRLTKRNPRAPDYKCRDRSCDGVIWPPKGNKPAASPLPPEERDDWEEVPEEIPF
jgi:hypothetical protein